MKFTLWPFSFEVDDSVYLIFPCVTLVLVALIAGIATYQTKTSCEAMRAGLVQKQQTSTTATVWTKP